MGTIFYLIMFLISFPLIVALVLLVAKTDAARGAIVKLAAACLAVGSIVLAVLYFKDGDQTFEVHAEAVNYVMMFIEAAIAVFIIIIGIQKKKYFASVFALVQTTAIIVFELTTAHGLKILNNMYIDRFSVIMVLIIGIIGSLITVFALGYMKDFQHHHADQKDRRPWFFFVMFLFLSAMFGLVLSNNLIWLYFFWEVTSLCSFFLIGFTKTKEAVDNSFRALTLNLLGGVGFAAGIILLGSTVGTIELDGMISIAKDPQYMQFIQIPAIFIAFAGLTKAAQMPFNSWLLGAMIAPTPTSALLHSSTMVKAGVFILIKLSPCFAGENNIAGLMVTIVGGVTFLMASFAAISQSNAKKVLAYSTIANLGLIVTCAGIGLPQAAWAGIMLIVFHAVTKSLLFLCVGTAEHNIGSRDIEDMDGLFGRMPRLAILMMIGITGMFLAPFGMLISKWASMTAFVDSGLIYLIPIICFGSAATAFYWTKWLGKLSAVVAKRENIQQNVHKEEWFVLALHAVFVVLLCIGFPWFSSGVVVPYLEGVFGNVAYLMDESNMYLMVAMLLVLLLLILAFFGKSKKKIVPIYMAGVNKGDDLEFYGSMQQDVPVSLRNWHMEKYFGEAKMTVIGGVVSAACIIIGLSLSIGALLTMTIGGGA